VIWNVSHRKAEVLMIEDALSREKIIAFPQGVSSGHPVLDQAI